MNYKSRLYRWWCWIWYDIVDKERHRKYGNYCKRCGTVFFTENK